MSGGRCWNGLCLTGATEAAAGWEPCGGDDDDDADC